MFCRKCGVKYISEGKFCFNCGYPVASEDEKKGFKGLEGEQDENIQDGDFTEHSNENLIIQDNLSKPLLIEQSNKKKDNLRALVAIVSVLSIAVIIGVFQSQSDTTLNNSSQKIEPSASRSTFGTSNVESQPTSELNEIVVRLDSQGRTFWTECVARPIIPITGYLFCFYPTIDKNDICNVSFFDSPLNAGRAVMEQRIVDLGDVWYGEDPDTGYGLVVSAPNYEDECFVDAMLGLEVEDWWVSNH